MKTSHLAIVCILVAGSMTVSQHAIAQNENPPVIITQVELGSPLRTLPNNQTCTFPPDPKLTNNCLVGLVPGHKVPCSYFLGSATCDPLHQWSSGTNRTCLKEYMTSSAPQWFDIYNTSDMIVDLQNFTAYDKLNYGPYGQDGPSSAILELKPHEGCTFPWIPIDEALTMNLNNMSMAISYNYNGQHYNVTTPSFSDTQNDTRTWQYDGNKWTFAQQGTVMMPVLTPLSQDEKMQMALPSPPAGLYQYTSKIFSVFQIQPETVHPNDTVTAQVLVTNNAAYPLYDVTIGEFSNDSRDITIYGMHKIDTLLPNQTGKILGLLHVFSGLKPTNYNDISWTVIARNQTGGMAESTQFQRNLPVMQPLPLYCCGKPVTISLEMPSPLQQLRSGTAIEDITCSMTDGKQTYLFLRAENHYPVCITSDAEDKLSKRGFVDTNQTIINQIVLKKAREFILSSPTFNRFGVQSTLSFDLKSCDLTVPQSCYPHAYFQVNGTGNYGNGTGSIPMASTKTSYHVMTITVFDMNQVQCAVVDGVWDEKNQKPLDKNDPLCGTWYGYKDGTG